MGMEFSGIEVNASVLGTGATLGWKVPGDDAVARVVVTFLEDRRLLFGLIHEYEYPQVAWPR